MRRLFPAALAALLLSVAAAACFAQTTAASDEFVVRHGDILKIRIWPDERLGGDYPVEESGYVYLPVIGGVLAGGVPLSTLRAELRRRYAEALREPAVSVTPIFNVGVLGAVQRPGLYQLSSSQTVFDAISLAGGFRPNAREDRVRLVRDGDVLEVNARHAIETGGGDLALVLRSGDRIVVPERRPLTIRDLLWTLQSIGLIITLLGR